MNESPNLAAPAEEVKPMSFSDKLAGVFSSPTELYDNVRQTPPTSSNWVIPTLILVLVGVILAYLITSNPTLADQTKRIASEQMEKGLQKQIVAGKMTQEQANQARDQMASFGGFTAIFTYFGAAVWPWIMLFLSGLFYWLLGKTVMKSAVPYMKVVEVVGLTFFIATLESVVTTVLQIGMNSVFASPSIALAFLSDFSLDNKMHLLASKINVFTFWELGVTSIGLARLFQKDTPKVLVLVFALWLLWVLFTVFVLAGLRG